MRGRAAVPLLVMACLVALPCGSAWAAGASGWAVQQLPVPSLAQTFSLSCSSSTACTAVATYYPFPFSGRDVLLALRWDGRGWSRAVMAEPPGNGTVLVSALSCPSASFCVAVGGSTGAAAGRYTPFAERWNGAGWSVEAVPGPARPALSSRLTSVSCTSPIACTAVGESVSRNPRRPPTPLVERWNGTTWSLEHASGGPLFSVSCSTRRTCTAVSDVAGRRFAEGWDGSTWSPQPNPHPRAFPAPNGDDELGSVSCASRSACMAVGYSTWGTGFNVVRITLAEYWNGTSWSVRRTPNPIQLDDLKGVSCYSAHSCVAVGDYTDRGGDATVSLVERWHGGRWSVLPTPRRLSAGKRSDSALQAVTCFAKGGCIAVGDAQGGPFAAEFSSQVNGSAK